MSIRVEAGSATAIVADVRGLRVAALWGLLAAKMLGGWGVQWDIRWHLLIGRDAFWIPPHVMTYAAVTLVAVISFGVLVAETWRSWRGERLGGSLPVWGLVGTRGFHLAWWGIALTILAAPLDDLWHRLFGLDVTLWSPPHLLGLAGAQVNTLGCLVIARELWPPASRAGRVALVWGGTLLLGAFYITVDPSVQTAFRRGGVFFFTWAVLGALAFAFTFVLLVRLTGLQSAPLILALTALALHWVGVGIAELGFALVQPTPALEEAIAADPDSPIAIAHEMARRNGSVPGRAQVMRLLPVLPAALMVLIDARRRWALASLSLGLGLLGSSAGLFARLPALSHALPSGRDVVAAVGAVTVAALIGGGLGRRFASGTPEVSGR